MAWYMRTAEDANSSDVYLPKTTLEKAGCVGTGAVVPIDPGEARPETLPFASIITPGNEKVPYPTGGGGGGAYLTTPAAVETTSTLVVPTLGADVMVNGGFTTDTVWTKGAGWTIAGGVAVSTATTNGNVIEQSQVATAGVTYQITYTIVALTTGSIRAFLRGAGGTLFVYGAVNNAVGTYIDYITAVPGHVVFGFRPQSASNTLTLDNVTMQPLL